MSKKSTKYFAIWIIAFFVLGMIIAIFSIHYAYTNNLGSMDIPEKAKFIIGIAVLVLFCPPLYIIYNVAKKELILICICVLSTILPCVTRGRFA